MIPLPLLWTLLNIFPWTSGSGIQIVSPELGKPGVITCTTSGTSCFTVHWFRTVPRKNTVQFLGHMNKAGRKNPGDEPRVRLSQASTKYMLTIHNVTEDDAGVYSCIIVCNQDQEFNPGTLLRPQALQPMTTTVKSKVTSCDCRTEKPSPDSCSPLILWPLSGLFGGLTLAILCTLYYFSRLPKKCRHHFVKKR